MEETFEVVYESIAAETDDAILLEVGGGNAVWIPRSQVIDHEVCDQVMVVPVWLARDRGLLP
jgi:hypothetical protein